MPNTKEVEQAAERKTLDMLLEYFVDHKNMDGPVTDDELKKEYESEFNLAMDLAIFGYNYALSNPLEQSENSQLKRKLEFYQNETAKIRDYVFDDSNKCGYPTQSIFEAITDKIDSLKAENDKLKSVEQSEKKEEWVSVETALPEDDLTVFVCNCEIANRIGVGWYFQRWYSTINEKVTHWMAVPKLPKPPKNLV